MKTVQRRFADLTAAIEDAHGIAVDGQHPELSPDIHSALAASLRGAVTGIANLVDALVLVTR